MGKKNKSRGTNMTEPETYVPSINIETSQDEVKSDEQPETEIVTPTETEKEPDMSEQSEPKKAVPESKVVPSKDTPRMVRQNTNVDKIKSLTLKFETAYNRHEETISTLIGISNYLNTTNDPKVFQAFFVWFVQHIDSCMDDQEALKGIHTIQNKRTKTRVEATHQCYMELARVLKSRPRSHYRFTVRAMRAMEVSERLALWLLQKASK